MGCGCNKKKVVPSLPSSSGALTTMSVEPRTYDVINTEGAIVASTTNLVFARVEARRTGGTVVLRETTSVPQA